MGNKELLQKQVDSIHSDYQKVSLAMNNIQTFADMNNLKVNWDLGEVTDK